MESFRFRHPGVHPVGMDPNVFPAGPRVTIRPWIDPVVDEHGHDPRSDYVERFWLGVIGPTATWIMRRFAAGFDAEPSGFAIDLADTATSMGLSYAKRTSSPFGKALQRCAMFGLVQPLSDGYSVRRRIPQVAMRHLRRLPDEVREAHDSWVRATVHIDVKDLEQHLISAGIPPRTAVRASEAALQAS
jgi:hypothetical protein